MLRASEPLKRTGSGAPHPWGRYGDCGLCRPRVAIGRDNTPGENDR